MLQRARVFSEHLFQKANHGTRGVLGASREAIVQFGNAQGIEASAAVSFFCVFSFFPLLLVLISILGFVLTSQQSADLVLYLTAEFLPVSPEWLEALVGQILQERNASGIIGLIGVLAAAVGVFLTLVRNINRAWPEAQVEPVYRGHLLSVGLLGILVSFIFLWIVWLSLIGFLELSEIPLINRLLPASLIPHKLYYRGFPLIGSFLFLMLVYHWLPNCKVRWSEAFWGALAAWSGWQVGTAGFIWYLSSQWTSYDFLYGSLGSSIALLSWVYYSAVIILFGAHLSHAIARLTGREIT